MTSRSSTRLFLIISIIAGGVLLGTNCSFRQKKPSPDLARIYNKAAKNHSREINPVIVIPGILGSKIIDPVSKKSIWGVYDNNFLNIKKPQNVPLIALPMYGTNERPRGIPNGAITSVRFRALGVPIQQRAYASIMQTLGVGGFLDQDIPSRDVDWGKSHFTCFQFDYDWRLSNAENAKALHKFILEKRKYIQVKSKQLYGVERKNVKFNIVAHSMGGLLARYYLRHGPQDLPNNGSLPPFKDLLEGQNFIPAWERILLGVNLPKLPPAVIATFPSVYELMPRTRHQPVLNFTTNKPLDIYNFALWKQQQWGILSPSEKDNLALLLPNVSSPAEREKMAAVHLHRCLKRAAQFQRSLDRPATPPRGLRISTIIGDATSTARQFKIDLTNNKRTNNDYAPGDGTVLRSSALADERVGMKNPPARIKTPIKFYRATFLPEDHIGLTSSPTFSDNILYQLLEQPN